MRPKRVLNVPVVLSLVFSLSERLDRFLLSRVGPEGGKKVDSHDDSSVPDNTDERSDYILIAFPIIMGVNSSIYNVVRMLAGCFVLRNSSAISKKHDFSLALHLLHI